MTWWEIFNFEDLPKVVGFFPDIHRSHHQTTHHEFGPLYTDSEGPIVFPGQFEVDVLATIMNEHTHQSKTFHGISLVVELFPSSREHGGRKISLHSLADDR